MSDPQIVVPLDGHPTCANDVTLPEAAQQKLSIVAVEMQGSREPYKAFMVDHDNNVVGWYCFANRDALVTAMTRVNSTFDPATIKPVVYADGIDCPGDKNDAQTQAEYDAIVKAHDARVRSYFKQALAKGSVQPAAVPVPPPAPTPVSSPAPAAH